MSVQAMAAVWQHSKARHGSLLVLLAVADHAKADGTGAWPAVETLATQARLSERAARDALRDLERLGELITHPGKGPRGTNLYDVILPGLGGAEIAGGQNGAPEMSQTAPEPPLTSTSTPDGVDDGQAVVRTPSRVDNLLFPKVQPILDRYSQGFAFDLVGELAEIWTVAWQAAPEAGVEQKAVGVKLCGYLYTAVVGSPPVSREWAQLGRLVGRWGKLALWGLDAALRRDVKDWLPYAQEVCDRLYRERQAKERAL